jgi:ABC-type Fe3+/spermidine/putrescine transport system ATPase subunit
MPAVRAAGVALGYGPTTVVDGLDLVVEPGEMVALLGPSGSGKSTILSAFAGFLPVRAGTIRMAGRVVAEPGLQVPPERRKVAVVFQQAALWPHLSALDIVAYPLDRAGIERTEARRQAAAILERLGIGRLADRRPADLSGGEQQRVGLGRALARGGDVFLFDEPTAHLDSELRGHLQAEIARQRRRTGAAAVYATHDTGEALALADRVALLRAGRVVQVGSPDDVYARPVDAWAARLTGPVSVLDARLLERADGHATIAIGETTIGVAIDGIAAPDRPIQALVRPDWARLGGSIAALVSDVAFRGTHTDVQLETAAGSLGIQVNGMPSVRRGERTTVAIDRLWVAPGVRADSG